MLLWPPQDPGGRLSVAAAAAHSFFNGVDVHRLHFEPPRPLAVGNAPPPPHDAKWARRQHSSIWAPELAAYDFSGERDYARSVRVASTHAHAQPTTQTRARTHNKHPICNDINIKIHRGLYAMHSAYERSSAASHELLFLWASHFLPLGGPPGPSAGRGGSSGAYALSPVPESPHERGASFLPPPAPKSQAKAHPCGLPRGLPLSGRGGSGGGGGARPGPRRLGPPSGSTDSTVSGGTDKSAGAAAAETMGFAALMADRGVEGGIAEEDDEEE